MLSETCEFTAWWLWHFLELGEEKQQFQKHLCILHNDLFYKETAQPGLCIPRMVHQGFDPPFGTFLIFFVLFQQINEKSQSSQWPLLLL